MIGLFGDVFWKEIISMIFSAKPGRVSMAVHGSCLLHRTPTKKNSKKINKSAEKSAKEVKSENISCSK